MGKWKLYINKKLIFNICFTIVMIVIFEGICASGKTTICKAWKQKMVSETRRGYFFFEEEYEKKCAELRALYSCTDPKKVTDIYIAVQRWINAENLRQIRNIHSLLHNGAELIVIDRTVLGSRGFIDHAHSVGIINDKQREFLVFDLSAVEDFWSYMLGSHTTIVFHLHCNEDDNLRRLESRDYPKIENLCPGVALDQEKQSFICKYLHEHLRDQVMDIISTSLLVNICTSDCSVKEAVDKCDAIVEICKLKTNFLESGFSLKYHGIDFPDMEILVREERLKSQFHA
jgi:thymidylate kinase